MNSDYVLYLQNALNQCRYLSDMLMIDYFVEDLWNKLPLSWRNFYEKELSIINDDRLKIIELIKIILRRPKDAVLYKLHQPEPLSILSLRQVIENVCLKQYQPIKEPNELFNILNLKSNTPIDIHKFSNLKEILPPALRLKIKRKKEHELSRIIDVVQILLENLSINIDEIIDIGAGVGHLSRILSLRYPNTVISTIEGNEILVETANKIDEKISSISQKKFKPLKRETLFVKEEGQLNNIIGKQLFLTGLHTCGDFAATILRHFVKNNDAKVLLNFGCCYYKLNNGLDKFYRDVYENEENYMKHTNGYPLSKSFSRIALSYASREVACFGHEQFIEKMNSSTDKKTLFVNCYRLILEWIILNCPDANQLEGIDNNYRHKGLRGFRGAENMDFWEYAKEALRDKSEIKQRFENNINDKPWLKETVEKLIEKHSFKTILLYTFRLLVAPVVEAVILRDRQAFMYENNISNCYLIPIFDPLLSPRNVALIAWK